MKELLAALVFVNSMIVDGLYKWWRHLDCVFVIDGDGKIPGEFKHIQALQMVN